MSLGVYSNAPSIASSTGVVGWRMTGVPEPEKVIECVPFDSVLVPLPLTVST